MLQVILGLVAATSEVGSSAPIEAERRLELQVTPVSVQLNSRDREHVGTLVRATWRVHRLFGFFVGGGYNWFNQPAPGMDALFEVQRIDAGWPTSAQMTWSSFVGVETIPISGDLRIGSWRSGRFGLAIALGGGPAGTRVRLKPETTRLDGTTSAATWGAGNLRLAGHGTIGWRFEVGAFTASLGVRATMWSDAVSSVNGCTVDDLRLMDSMIRRGVDPTSPRADCQIDESNDVPLALNVVRVPRSELVVNLAGEFALSWSFF